MKSTVEILQPNFRGKQAGGKKVVFSYAVEGERVVVPGGTMSLNSPVSEFH